MSRFFFQTGLAINEKSKKHLAIEDAGQRARIALGDVDFGEVFYNTFLTRYSGVDFFADIMGAIVFPIISVIGSAIIAPFALISLALSAIVAALACVFCLIGGLLKIVTGQFSEGFGMLALPIIVIYATAVIVPIATLLATLAYTLNIVFSWVSLVTSSIATAGAAIGDLFAAPDDEVHDDDYHAAEPLF